jgi:hypothetical protein
MGNSMKRIIAFIIIMIISNMAFSQQEIRPDTVPNDSVNKKSNPLIYQGIFESGYSLGIGEWGQSVFRLNGIVAIRLPHYSIGLGTGFSIVNRNENQFDGMRFNYMVPIFLDNRVYFSIKKVQPYLSAGIGLSFIAHNMLADYSLFINSSTGIFWKISDSASLIIGIAIESYKIQYEPGKADNYAKQSISLGPNIGISF